MQVVFKNILLVQIPHLDMGIPEGYKCVDHLHITLLSNELGKDVRKELKSKDLSILAPFPSVSFGSPYCASNGAKESYVCDCIEQDAIRTWVENAIATLGIAVTLNPARVYHVSVANRTGSVFDSVPDPWNHRI
jgi:hypothetical protein